MTLNLHGDCLSRIRSELASILGSMQVRNGVFIDIRSVGPLIELERVLPSTGTSRAHLNDFIDEQSLFSFVMDHLEQELHETQRYDSNSELIPLSSLSPFEDVESAARKIVEAFNSLPWNYAFSMALPHVAGSGLHRLFAKFPLNEQASLLIADQEFAKKFPRTSGDSSRDRTVHGLGLLARSSDISEWPDQTPVLQFQRSGFIASSGLTNTARAVIEDFKAFFGLGLALRLFKKGTSWMMSWPRQRIFVHELGGDEGNLLRSLEMEADASELLGKIELQEYELETSDLSALRRKILGDISVAFAPGERSHQIKRAGRWFFDSRAGSNELLSYLQLMVSLEILLGDKKTTDLIGLNELLRNRCAYLIGKSARERDELLRDFSRIYDVRSHIVHRGKSQLSSDEKMMFYKLEWITSRVLAAEIKLSAANPKSI